MREPSISTKSWDGLRLREFVTRVLFSISLTVAIGLAAFFAIRFFLTFHG